MQEENSVPNLQQLIYARMKGRGLSRSKLIQSLGYSNIPKGLRRLDDYLSTLHAPSDKFINDLLSVLDIEGMPFYRALNLSQHQVLQRANRKAKENFNPHLVLMIKERMKPIYGLHILWHEVCYRPLPLEIQNLPFNEEVDFVTAQYQLQIDNLGTSEYHRTMGIQGFRYYRSYDNYLEFNVDCVLKKTVFESFGVAA